MECWSSGFQNPAFQYSIYSIARCPPLRAEELNEALFYLGIALFKLGRIRG
jgi:hypothetical protein